MSDWWMNEWANQSVSESVCRSFDRRSFFDNRLLEIVISGGQSALLFVNRSSHDILFVIIFVLRT